MRVLAWGLAGAIAWAVTTAPASVQAQESTLADIRQDLAVLTVELQRLTRELSTTGASSVQIGGDALQRTAAIEAELQRVIAKTEELEYRITQVAKDGANRIGDLQFRVCELEPGCDLGSIGASDPLGGVVVTPTEVVNAPTVDDLPAFTGELAFAEEEDFRAAEARLASGDFGAAAQSFARFRDTYPGGPLEPAAYLGEGRALAGLGDTREAARRYLAAYSGFPDAPVAPEALWRLGVSLGDLGSTPEACVTLGEVAKRYPGSDVVTAAADSLATLSCP